MEAQNIQVTCSSLASPDSETTPNHLVLMGHNIQNDLARLEEMKISESFYRHIFQQCLKTDPDFYD